MSDPGGPATGPKQIHLMLVDDSAIIRGALARILENDPAITIVASVSNGQMGVDSAKKYKPHVVIMDIEMPVMDGITALPKILEASPESKVIMFSTLTEKGASVTMEAMQLGAVECLLKPTTSTDVGKGSEFQDRLLGLIKNLAPEDIRRVADSQSPAAADGQSAVKTDPSKPGVDFQLRQDPHAYTGKPSILAIGSSTGGPQALFKMLKHCQGFDIPIILTQHMPKTFTRILAQHIEQQCGIPAQEGENGMPVQAGRLYVAPGGFHMELKRNASENGPPVIKLDDGPPVNFCKPAVDPMFLSAIELYGRKVLGVILTGMGHDGINGGKALVAKGGRLIAQDEATSIVWGMPGTVAKEGLCSEVLPIDEIGPWIKKAVSG